MNSSNIKVGLIILFLVAFIGCGEKTIPAEFKDKILYVCDDGLCTINPDGTELKKIVSLKLKEYRPLPNPKWSPDKKKIAFTGIVEDNARIVLIDSDGSNRKVVSLPDGSQGESKRDKRVKISRKYDLEFRGWSTSGKFLLYRYGPVLDATPFGVISTQGEIVVRLHGIRASFSGKDRLVYCVWYRAGGNDIFSYDLSTKENQNLTNTKGETLIEYYPATSPDGKIIVFKRSPYSDSDNELWIMHFEGTGKKRLASLGKDFKGIAWGTLNFSPDGDKIMYVSYDGDKSQIYIINTDGTELKAITDKIVKGFGGADWSPDGEHIIFTSNIEGNDELYIVNVDGTGLRRLTNNTTSDCCPDW